MTAADHTPSPATDGLREAIEALLRRAGMQSMMRRTVFGQFIESVGVAELRVIADDALAAHPAPLSETATEGVTRVEWGVGGRPGYGLQIATWTTDPGGNTRQYDEALARYDARPGQLFRRTVTEFAPIVGEWEPVEETQP